MQQIWLPDIDRVDRCTTCHLGVTDASTRDAAAPFRAHPGRWLETHRPDRFGCTSCHGGEGEATSFAAARAPRRERLDRPDGLARADGGALRRVPPRAPAAGRAVARPRARDHRRPQLHRMPRAAGLRRVGGAGPPARRARAEGLAGVAARVAEAAARLLREDADGGVPAVRPRRRGAVRVPARPAAARDARDGRLVEGERREGRRDLPPLALRDVPRGRRPRRHARAGAHARGREGLARVALSAGSATRTGCSRRR